MLPIPRTVTYFVLAQLALTMSLEAAHADRIADGRKYYLQYCAACHGQNADGQGPTARALKEQPADLRTLWVKFGRPLPTAQVAAYIDGRKYVAAHGSREMPVWGERFYDIWEAKQEGAPDLTDRIRMIVDYLNTIQVKPGPMADRPTAVSSPASSPKPAAP